MASPFGQYCRAIVWLITASAAPRMISSRAPEASLRHRNVEKRKILGADEIRRGRPASRAHRLPRISSAAVAAVRRRRGVGRDPGRHHLRHRGNRRPKPLEVLGPLLPRLVGAVVDGDRQRHGVLRVVSEVGVRQPQESLARRAGRGQHQERQRDLDRDHDAMNLPALRAADHASSAGLRHAAEVRTRELQRRPDAEHDRGHDRQRRAEQAGPAGSSR